MIGDFKTDRDRIGNLTSIGMGALGEQMEEPKTDAKGVQVAGPITNSIKKLLLKRTDKVINKVQNRGDAIEEMAVSELESTVGAGKVDAETFFTPENIDKVISSISGIEDMNRVLDVAGTKSPKETFEDVASAHNSVDDVTEELIAVGEGKRQGLLTSKQLHGLNRLVTTVGARTRDMAARIAEGDATPQLLLEYKKAHATYGALYGMAKNEAAGVARALNQQKMLSKTLKGDIRGMSMMMQMEGNGPEGIVQHAKVFNNEVKKGGVDKAMDHMANKATSKWRVVMEYWKNNILSGLETHAINLSSVAITNVWENVALRPLAGAIGAVRSATSRNEVIDRVYMSETLSAIAGGFSGFTSGLRMAARTLATGESSFGLGKGEYRGEIHQMAKDLGMGKFGQGAADMATLSFRMLRAEDEVGRGTAFTQQLYALATRDGKMQGLSGAKLIEYVNNTVDEPPQAMYDEAMDFASEVTFTSHELKGVIGTMAAGMRSVAGKIPPLQFVVPFFNTPANLLQYAINNSGVLTPSLLRSIKASGAKKDMALARMTGGLAMSVGIYQLYAAGLLTGPGPGRENYATQKVMEKSGWQPNSMVIDGKTYEITRMEPFSIQMQMILSEFDKAKYAKTQKDSEYHIMKAAMAAGEKAFDSTWMQGISGLFDVMAGKKDAATYVGNLAGGFVPYSGALKSAKKLDDPATRKPTRPDEFYGDFTEGVKQKVMSGLPGLSKFVRPGRYWDGTIMQPQGLEMAWNLSPLHMATIKKDTITDQLIANGVTPSDPPSVLSLGGVGFSLLQMDDGKGFIYDMYIKNVGIARREILSDIVSKGSYDRLSEGPNGERSIALLKGVNAATKKGLKYFLDELEQETAKNPQLYAQMAQTMGVSLREFLALAREQAEAGQPGYKMKGTPKRKPIEIFQ